MHSLTKNLILSVYSPNPILLLLKLLIRSNPGPGRAPSVGVPKILRPKAQITLTIPENQDKTFLFIRSTLEKAGFTSIIEDPFKNFLTGEIDMLTGNLNSAHRLFGSVEIILFSENEKTRLVIKSIGNIFHPFQFFASPEKKILKHLINNLNIEHGGKT